MVLMGEAERYFRTLLQNLCSLLHRLRLQILYWSRTSRFSRSFVAAVDWKEPWLITLGIFYVLLILLAVYTRRKNNIQMTLFVFTRNFFGRITLNTPRHSQRGHFLSQIVRLEGLKVEEEPRLSHTSLPQKCMPSQSGGRLHKSLQSLGEAQTCYEGQERHTWRLTLWRHSCAFPLCLRGLELQPRSYETQVLPLGYNFGDKKAIYWLENRRSTDPVLVAVHFSSVLIDVEWAKGSQ